MNTLREFALISLYVTFVLLFIVSYFEYTFGFLAFDFYALLIGSSLGFLQIVLSLHVYWKQTITEDEFEAQITVFDNPCRRAIVKKIFDSGTAWMSQLVREIDFSSSEISANLMELENNGVIRAKPELLPNSARAVKMYSISPNFRKLIKKLRSRL